MKAVLGRCIIAVARKKIENERMIKKEIPVIYLYYLFFWKLIFFILLSYVWLAI